MDCTTHPPTPANVPIILHRPKPADIVGEVLAKLRATRDPAKQAALLSLGIDVLRRRQAQRQRGGRCS
jgi:hypothetical protein